MPRRYCSSAAKTKPLKAIYFDGRGRRMLKSQQPFDHLLDLRSYRDMGDPIAASWIPAWTKVALRNAYPGKFVWVPLPAEGEIYDVLFPLPSAVPGGSTQDIENHHRLAEFLFPDGPECRNALPRPTISGADRAELAQFLEKHFAINGGVPFLLVCPGTSSPIKVYPIDALASSLRQVLPEHPLPVVIAGSAQDARTIEPLVAALSAFAKVTDISGALDLARHVTLIAMAAALLSMDSCQAHIAGAVGTPAVVVHGGSTDDSLAIIQSYPHLQWIFEPDRGISDGINKGFRRATDNWVMWLSADDCLLPGALERVMRFVAKHPEADVCWCSVR